MTDPAEKICEAEKNERRCDFINEYVIDETILAESNYKVCRRNRIIAFIFMLCMIFICLITSIGFSADAVCIAGIIAVIYFLISLIVVKASAKYIAKKQIEQLRVIDGKNELIGRVEFADKIYIIGTKNEVYEHDYTGVLELHESKNLYLLRLKANVYIRLKKSAFILGAAKRFPEYIHVKCPVAKIKIKSKNK